MNISISLDQESIVEFLKRMPSKEKSERSLFEASTETKVSIVDLMGLTDVQAKKLSEELKKAFVGFEFKGRSLSIIVSDVERMGLDTLYLTSDATSDKIRERAVSINSISKVIEEKLEKMNQVSGLSFELLSGAITESEAEVLSSNLDVWMGIFANRKKEELNKIKRVVIGRRNDDKSIEEKSAHGQYLIVDFANNEAKLREAIDGIEKSAIEKAVAIEERLKEEASELDMELKVEFSGDDASRLEALSTVLIPSVKSVEGRDVLRIKKLLVSSSATSISLSQGQLSIPLNERASATAIVEFLKSEIKRMEDASRLPDENVSQQAQEMLKRLESNVSSEAGTSVVVKDQSGAQWSGENIQKLSQTAAILQLGLKKDEMTKLQMKKIHLEGNGSKTYFDATQNALIVDTENLSAVDLRKAIDDAIKNLPPVSPNP